MPKTKVPGLSLNTVEQIFLCPRCLRVMCEDCISTADEYQYRDHGLKVAAFEANEKILEMTVEMDRIKKELEDWKRIATMGYTEVIVGYLESLKT